MYIYTYVYMHICIYAYTYIYIYICNPAHRVSRPRGTGSVGDSVGEGAVEVIWPLRTCLSLAFTAYRGRAETERSARCLRRSLTTGMWPSRTALCMGVSESASERTLALAPYSSTTLAHSTWPPAAAYLHPPPSQVSSVLAHHCTSAPSLHIIAHELGPLAYTIAY